MPSVSTKNELLSLDYVQKSEIFEKKLQKLSSRGELDNTPDDNFYTPFKLLPSEYVQYYSQMNNNTLIVLTNFRLFVDLNCKQGFYNILIRSIDSVECREIFYLYVYCKDGRCAKIIFDNNESCLVWFRLLTNAANPPSNINDIFAFSFHTCCNTYSTEGLNEMGFKPLNANGAIENDVTFNESSTKQFSSDDFDTKTVTTKEFDRLAFNPTFWRITNVNESYKLCSTYPKFWIVPQSITDQDIEIASRYRSLRRVPAVVWRHRSNCAVLVRCSQPESGIFCWRSPADELLLQEIFNNVVNESRLMTESSTSQRNGIIVNGDQQPVPGTNKPMLILDARSYAAAWANRAKGGGFESTENYQKCEINFLGLANIHNIRYSFQKLRTLLWDSSAELNFFQNLDACQWIYHLLALLSSALRVVEALHVDGRSVLVHCSDGWDRTTQIVSLAKLLLDSYYRTMKGFKELVEREWIAFGHKFGERSGLVPGDPSQRAPVFLQWLDCVRCIMRENRCAFEFNETYLVKLAQHVYSGLFGNFLCNSVCEYLSRNVGPRTMSIWSYLHQENCQFRNLLYVSHQSGVLMPRFSSKDVTELWRSVYCPVDDPANVRPRSFSTASADDKLDRSLTRAHSCDNLTNGAIPESSDNLIHHLHRTGSDSSLTATTKSNISLHNLNISDKEAVEDTLKQLKKESDRRHSTSDTFPQIHLPMTIGDNNLCNRSSTDEKPEPLSSSVPPAFSFVQLMTKESGSFEVLTSKQNELAVNNIGTSTTDLLVASKNCCNGGAALPVVTFANEPSVHKLQPVYVKEKSPPSTNGDTNNILASTSRLPTCRADLTKSIMRKDKKLAPFDLIDSDGLKKHFDPMQQRVRDIILDYEKRLELRQMEIDRLKSYIIRQEQNGGNLDDIDIYARIKNGRTTEVNGDAFEPTSLESRGSEASWEAVDENDSRVTLWVPDHAVSHCMSCGEEFWAVKRKHHCRNCGKIFCNSCSNYECPVPEEQFFDPVRVCYKCYESLCTTNGIVSPS